MAQRITQEPVEVPIEATGADLNRRITQQPVEVAIEATGASLNRRITQIAIEVPVQQPKHPLESDPWVVYPPWSAAYIQDNVEPQAINFASYWGIHSRRIDLGWRNIWQEFIRR